MYTLKYGVRARYYFTVINRSDNAPRLFEWSVNLPPLNTVLLAFLTAAGISFFIIVTDVNCAQNPSRSQVSHLRPSVKKPEMTALKAGDTFPGDVKFR